LIPHSRPTVAEDDARRVADVVRSGQLAQGAEVAAFEGEMAARLGAECAVAVASGSVALEAALQALAVGPGDEVIIPSYVCDALHHAVTRVGAVPVLADADGETLGISAKDAARRITARTRGLIAVHPFGRALDLDDLLELGVPVIEDCAQTLAATGDGSGVGRRGTLVVCSFYATKLLTTGEGGMVLGPRMLLEPVRSRRDYDGHADLAPRFNAKLTDIQAALGRSQLARLDAFIARRRAIAARYRAALRGAPCRPPLDVGDRHVFHRFVVAVERPLDELILRLHARGVVARRPVLRPLHLALGLPGYPAADAAWSESLSLPCYPSLTDAEIDQVATALREALRS
jgi:dTDP-4-amino-4,6-dideoxygalactose transaminase